MASSQRCSKAGRTAIVLALPVMIETTPPPAAQWQELSDQWLRAL
jgi:hypothetical protein